MQIYLDNGYSKREAVRSILENNLFGLDIDKRAAQFAYFSVMMKAREYDSGFFDRKTIPQPRVYDIQESNWMGGAYKHEMGNFLNSQAHRDTLNYLLDAFIDAKEYGSILQIKPLDYEGLKEAWETSAAATAGDINMVMWYDAAKDAVAQLIEQAIMLSQKYDAVVTNPPYMGASGMGAKLSEFVKEKYPDTKSDMSTVCMERTIGMCKNAGYMAMINIPVWMTLPSYEELRKNILNNNTLITVVHPGRGIFGSDFGTVTFVINKSSVLNYRGIYCKLFENQGEVESIEKREEIFLQGKERFYSKQEEFKRIPGETIAYWASDKFIDAFQMGRPLGDIGTTRKGMYTGLNEQFVRAWYEVSKDKTAFHTKRNEYTSSGKKWFPYANGGDYRKWYGNWEDVVNWENDGNRLRTERNAKGSIRAGCFNLDYIFKEGVVWSSITSSKNSMRILQGDALFSSASNAWFGQNTLEILAFMNSKVAEAYLFAINPSINANPGDIGKLPVLATNDNNIKRLAEENVNIAKNEWDSFETSWDFKRHPLV